MPLNPIKFQLNWWVNSHVQSFQDYHRRFSVNQGLPELQNSEWCAWRWVNQWGVASGKLTVCDIENGPLIVDLAINSMVIFYSYVSPHKNHGDVL